MTTREELKSIIDHMNDDELLAASTHLLSVLSRHSRPRLRQGESDRLQQRAAEFGAAAEQHWCEASQQAKASGYSLMSGFGGGGSLGSVDHRGRASGKVEYSYWAGEASVTEKLLVFAAQEVEIVERVALSDEETELIYEQRVSSGGRTVNREERFPYKLPSP